MSAEKVLSLVAWIGLNSSLIWFGAVEGGLKRSIGYVAVVGFALAYAHYRVRVTLPAPPSEEPTA